MRIPAESPDVVQPHHTDPQCGHFLKATIWLKSMGFCILLSKSVSVSRELWLYYSWTNHHSGHSAPIPNMLSCNLLFIPHVLHGNSVAWEGQKKCFKHSLTTGLRPLWNHNLLTKLCYVGHLRKFSYFYQRPVCQVSQQPPQVLSKSLQYCTVPTSSPRD